MKRLHAAFGFIATLTAATPAFAGDLDGHWLFDTSKFADNDCHISGQMTFTETKVRNTYSCRFVSEQICGPINGNLYIKVEQSCTAQKVGTQVAIKAKVDKILERRPQIADPELAVQSYLADNFMVQLSKNLQEMIGEHYDEQRQLKVRFWRD
jgi:hypothetical protein